MKKTPLKRKTPLKAYTSLKAKTPLELAIMFHDTYEELAPKFNYETRKDTKEFDENSNNGKLMIAVCSKLLDLIKEYEEKVSDGNG